MKYVCAVLLLITLLFPKKINAFGIYKRGTQGFDISYPQCPNYFPQYTYSFGIVGVNRGKAFTRNTCLQQEYVWAKKANTDVSLYMNLNFPSGDALFAAFFGPHGNCKKNDIVCQAYNYGYNAARDAQEYAASQFITSKVWWIDVETANTWSDNVVMNNYVLQGAIDYFNAEHIRVGIYSTSREWKMIMGSEFIPMQAFIYPIPNWIGTGLDEVDPSRCLKPFIQNSPVWIVQYANNGYDGNYICI